MAAQGEIGHFDATLIRPTGPHPQDTVSQYRFIEAFSTVMILTSLANLIASIPIFIFVSRELAIIPLSTFILYITSSRRSTARRYFVNFQFYRTPRFARISEYLATRMHLSWYINIAVQTIVTIICWHALGTGVRFFIWILVFSTLSTTTCNGAVKAHLKYLIDAGFRIVVFRRYSLDGAVRHKGEVMPLCGLYGQVLLFTDATLGNAWEGGQHRMERWVFSEQYQPMVAGEETVEWHAVVDTELRYADIVLLDWSGEISENMVWELRRALDFVPFHRVIIITSDKTDNLASSILADCSGRGDPGNLLLLPAPSNGLTTLLFRFAFMQRMRALRPEPRFWPRQPASERGSGPS